TALVNEIWSWYTTEKLPSDAANAAAYTTQNYVGTLPNNISGSVLCHPSVSQWCLVADKKVSDVERKERCARLAGDIAAKTAEVLNDYLHASFVSTFHDTESVTGCMDCHSKNTLTHMECVSCHSTAHHQNAVSAQSIGANAVGYSLDNAYPNPFYSSTTIQFAIPDKEKVRLEIYDIKGRLVNSLIDSDYMEKGTYNMEWNGTNNMGEKVVNGTYLAKLTTGNFMKSVKISYSK
ncbi:MAG TPA: FlgD immunoglobulin-like domain containing protein, partial [Prolixibacteraceae bacterium]|nr:FlgD immunoglobulin-like domain containing protein [Prolixibacteraceae bacterium]